MNTNVFFSAIVAAVVAFALPLPASAEPAKTLQISQRLHEAYVEMYLEPNECTRAEGSIQLVQGKESFGPGKWDPVRFISGGFRLTSDCAGWSEIFRFSGTPATGFSIEPNLRSATVDATLTGWYHDDPPGVVRDVELELEIVAIDKSNATTFHDRLPSACVKITSNRVERMSPAVAVRISIKVDGDVWLRSDDDPETNDLETGEGYVQWNSGITVITFFPC